MQTLTTASHDLFMFYAEDAGEWSGTPWVDGNITLTKQQRGNLSDLVQKGLMHVHAYDRDNIVIFTDAGKAYAAEHGVDLSWIK